MTYLEQAREMFAKDTYATKTTGIVIDSAEPGRAVCSLELDERHTNAHNAVMGGVIFTLADFAFGIIANVGNLPTVTLNSSISYLGVAKGSRLIAEATMIKSGRSTCVSQVTVRDDLGNEVAFVTLTGFRKQPR